MTEIETFYKVGLAILSLIITIGGATAVITKWLTPYKNLKKEVADLKADLEKLKQYQTGDHNELKKIEIGTEKICKCVLAITDHELTGNSVDNLRNAKNEMQEYLITK